MRNFLNIKLQQKRENRGWNFLRNFTLSMVCWNPHLSSWNTYIHPITSSKKTSSKISRKEKGDMLKSGDCSEEQLSQAIATAIFHNRKVWAEICVSIFQEISGFILKQLHAYKWNFLEDEWKINLIAIRCEFFTIFLATFSILMKESNKEKEDTSVLMYCWEIISQKSIGTIWDHPGQVDFTLFDFRV